MKKNLSLLIIMLVFLACEKQQVILKDLSDLKNISIGAMTGSTGEALAKARFTEASVKSFDNIMDGIAALKAGQLEAIITAYPTAMNVCKHNKDLTILKEPVDYEKTAMAVRKDSPELLNQLNEIIQSLKKDGTLKDMKKRWLKSDFSPYVVPEIDLPKTGKVLKVGASATREPFCFVNEQREVTGHDGELARRIGRALGRPIEFVDLKFAALIPALQSGKVDVIISCMTATKERQKSVNFTEMYFQNSQVILARNQGHNQAKLKTLADIADKKVGVYAGTVHDDFVVKNYPKATVSRFNTTSDMILALNTEKIDVCLLDLYASKTLIKENPQIGILTEDVLTQPLGYGFNKNNSKLVKEFNNFLIKIKANGKFDEIHHRWFEEDLEKVKMPDFPTLPNGKELVLGVAIGDLPYIALVDNEYVGFDIEMIKTFAQDNNYNLTIKTMNFSALIAAVSSGKVDMIADGISITDERKEKIAFSDPYSLFKTGVLVLKKNMLKGLGTDATSVQNDSSEENFFESIATGFHSNIIKEHRYLLILDGLKTTALIAVFAIIFGTILGGMICFMRMSSYKMLLVPAKIFISVLRGTPVLVVLMITFYVIFASVDINPIIVAVFAFGMNFGAYASEMFRTGIESVDRGQTEAGVALGFSRMKTFIYIILPQAVRRILPVYKGEIISLVKMTSIVGYIAVQDLTKASDIIRSRTFDAFFPLIMVAVLYYLISWLLMILLSRLERMLNPKNRVKRV